MSSSLSHQLRWRELTAEARDALTGKLVGLWGAVSDEAAFDSLTEDKQQALLLVLNRMQAKALWHLVRSIDNVYGESGVGIAFTARPFMQSTLSRRRDFTQRFAKHKNTSGGFYEKGRAEAVLHFLFQEGSSRKWYVHFDLYSPVHSLGSAGKHLRYEFLGKTCPDWKMIKQYLKA
jgi:hypothetical protein